MSIPGAVIVPHPPLIIPTVGRGREQEVQVTIDAYQTAAKQAAAWEPEVLIITSPHQIMYVDYFHILAHTLHQLYQFVKIGTSYQSR